MAEHGMATPMSAIGNRRALSRRSVAGPIRRVSLSNFLFPARRARFAPGHFLTRHAVRPRASARISSWSGLAPRNPFPPCRPSRRGPSSEMGWRLRPTHGHPHLGFPATRPFASVEAPFRRRNPSLSSRPTGIASLCARNVPTPSSLRCGRHRQWPFRDSDRLSSSSTPRFWR